MRNASYLVRPTVKLFALCSENRAGLLSIFLPEAEKAYKHIKKSTWENSPRTHGCQFFQ